MNPGGDSTHRDLVWCYELIREKRKRSVSNQILMSLRLSRIRNKRQASQSHKERIILNVLFTCIF